MGAIQHNPSTTLYGLTVLWKLGTFLLPYPCQIHLFLMRGYGSHTPTDTLLGVPGGRISPGPGQHWRCSPASGMALLCLLLSSPAVTNPSHFPSCKLGTAAV